VGGSRVLGGGLVDDSRAWLRIGADRGTRMEHEQKDPGALRSLSAAAQEAWRLSYLASLSESATEAMLEGCQEVRVPAGEVTRGGVPLMTRSQEVSITLVVAGVLRAYIHSAVGREVTVCHYERGDFAGLPRVLAASGWGHDRDAALTSLQALEAAHVVFVSRGRFRAALESMAETPIWRIIQQLADISMNANVLLATHMFTPVRVRLARQLLELAKRDDSRLVVLASQQELADAIGSVREVVSRNIVAFKSEGLVARSGRGLELLDLSTIYEIAHNDTTLSQ
jgi:CRP-like cAMP-binding protein